MRKLFYFFCVLSSLVMMYTYGVKVHAGVVTAEAAYLGGLSLMSLLAVGLNGLALEFASKGQ